MENVIIDSQREYDLRRKTSQQTPNTKISEKSSQNNTTTKPKVVKQKNKTVAVNSDKGREKGTQNNEKQSADLSSTNTSDSTPVKTILSNVNRASQQTDFADRAVANKAETSTSKNQIPFSLEQEISKIKIFVPLTELATQNVYRIQILKALNIEDHNDIVNLNDDQPELIFGPKIEGRYQEGPVPTFYVSLNVHDKILHNDMHDSGASHNLMPKAVMESLGLEITRPYKYFYSFDSRRVKCLALIKYLCVNLAQILAK